MEQTLRTNRNGEASQASDVLFVVRKLASYPDIVDGLEQMVIDGTIRGGCTLEVDPALAATGEGDPWARVIEHVERRGTEFVVLHHFHSPRLPDPRPSIRQLQSLSHRPVVAITNGDAFFNGFFRPSFHRSFLEAAEVADAVFSTSMGVSADHLARRTQARVALLPNGVCQTRFTRPAASLRRHPPEYRVVLIGSNNRSRHPLHAYHWYGRRRQRLVRLLGAKFGSGFALFGRGWEGVDGWRGPIPFAEQQLACQRAQVVVGGVPFSPARYYTSDRVFIQIASGVPFVDLAVEGTETFLREEQHWHLARSLEEVVDVCDDLLSRSADELADLGQYAADFTFDNHTVEARCRSLIVTLSELREAILTGRRPPPPDLRFLLPEVDRKAELPLATRLWDEPRP